ncbi:MAG: ISAzo13 family transposase, partial [Acidimicrobiia bacterium]
FAVMALVLDEQQRRLLAGAVARLLGRGGPTAVARAAGISRNTVIHGAQEVEAGPVPTGRVRREGGGRPRLVELDPALLSALDDLMEPPGGAASPLRWTLRSTRLLAEALSGAGHEISHRSVEPLLRAGGYSWLGGVRRPRGATKSYFARQFQHIADLVSARLAAGEPVITVSCKTRHLGRDGSGHPEGGSEEAGSPGLRDPGALTALLHGAQDLESDKGWSPVGDGVEAPFAVAAIRHWWQTMGSPGHPEAERLTVVTEAGSPGDRRGRHWKMRLAELATETGLAFTVCHYPPGIFKWQCLEHRLVCFGVGEWRGGTLDGFRTAVELVGGSPAPGDFVVRVRWEPDYHAAQVETKETAPPGAVVSHSWPGEWNYDVTSRS